MVAPPHIINTLVTLDIESLAEVLHELTEEVNRRPSDERRVVSKLLSGVKSNRNNSNTHERVVEHLTSYQDEVSGAYGFIHINLAKDRGIVPLEMKSSSWKFLITRVAEDERIKPLNLRKHTQPAPIKNVGRPPALYITDDCNIESLYSSTSSQYEITVPEQAERLATLIASHTVWDECPVTARVDLRNIREITKNNLIPDFGAGYQAISNKFIRDNLIDRLPKGRRGWEQQGPFILMKRE